MGDVLVTWRRQGVRASVRRFRLAWLLAAATLMACGGGGGDPKPSTGGPDQPGFPPTTKVFTLDPSVSPQLRASVTEVLSPVGAALPGSPVAIPSTLGAPSIPVVAVDARGRILMAALASGSGELSADSTASALVMWLAGPQAVDEAAEPVHAQARAVEAYPSLVAAVAAAQRNAEPVTDNGAVRQALLAVVQQVATRLRAPPLAGTPGRARTLAVASPRVKESGQALVQTSFGGLPMRITVHDTNFRSAIIVSNATPLHWAIRTERQDGSALAVKSPEANVVDGYGIVEGASVLRTLVALVPGAPLLGIAPELELEDLPREGFNVRVRQTKESWQQNWRAAIQDGARLALDHGLSSAVTQKDRCYLEIANATLQAVADQLAELEPNVSNLKDMLGRAMSNATAIFDSCAPDRDAATRKALQRFATILVPEVLALAEAVDRAADLAGDVNELVTLVARLWKMKLYREHDQTFGVCETVSPLGNGTIVNCLHRLEIVPPTDPVTGEVNASPTYLVGARADLQVHGYDADGQRTVIPASLRAVNAFPHVMNVDTASLRLEALSAGTAAFDLRDAATDAHDAFIGRVVQTASLKAERTTLAVGDSTGLRLVDPFDRYLFTAGAPLTWASSEPEALSIGFAPAGSHASVTALRSSSGPVVVTATSDGREVATLSFAPIQPVAKFLDGAATCSYLCAPGGASPFGCTNFRVDYTWTVEAPTGDSIRSSLSSAPNNYSSTTRIDCGAWTPRTEDGMDGVCTRAEGQPERTVVSGSRVGGYGGAVYSDGPPTAIVGRIGPEGAVPPTAAEARTFTCR